MASLRCRDAFYLDGELISAPPGQEAFTGCMLPQATTGLPEHDLAWWAYVVIVLIGVIPTTLFAVALCCSRCRRSKVAFLPHHPHYVSDEDYYVQSEYPSPRPSSSASRGISPDPQPLELQPSVAEEPVVHSDEFLELHSSVAEESLVHNDEPLIHNNKPLAQSDEPLTNGDEPLVHNDESLIHNNEPLAHCNKAPALSEKPLANYDSADMPPARKVTPTFEELPDAFEVETASSLQIVALDVAASLAPADGKQQPQHEMVMTDDDFKNRLMRLFMAAEDADGATRNLAPDSVVDPAELHHCLPWDELDRLLDEYDLTDITQAGNSSVDTNFKVCPPSHRSMRSGSRLCLSLVWGLLG